MNELFRTIAKKIFSIAQGGFSGAIISILPATLIYHRHICQFFQNLDWTLIGFFAICIVTGSIVYLFSPPQNFPWAALFYLFCYTACAALCQKTALTLLYLEPCRQISSNLSTIPPLITIPGLVLIFLAAITQIKAALKNHQASEPLPNSTDEIASKHPFYESWLLFMAGVPLLFGVWLPLLALPGAWVFIKWIN